MDDMAVKFQEEKGLNAQDMRILNWHFANLEYSNAIDVSRLSLGGWDQDSGNEFEGRHSQVIGGYSQVISGLYSHPSKLDVRLGCKVKQVDYHSPGAGGPQNGQAILSFTDGQSMTADHVVSTLPLGVLHHNDVSFQPPLPKWKRAAMDRLGFGVLNKASQL